MASLPFRHFIDGSLAFVFPILTWQTLRSAFSENAHHSGLFTRAASGGLRPGPATRSRGAHPHLLCSKAFLDDHLDLLSCRRGTQSRGEVGITGGLPHTLAGALAEAGDTPLFEEFSSWSLTDPPSS